MFGSLCYRSAFSLQGLLSSQGNTEGIVVRSSGTGDVFRFVLFCTRTQTLLFHCSLALSARKLQVSFPCQVLRPAMLSILLSYLKNVEYQQWLSLVHCQLLYEAILAE